MFNLNLHMMKKEYHVYSTDDFALAELGIASYTKGSLKSYLGSGNADLVEFFRPKIPSEVMEKLLQLTTFDNLSIVEFDDKLDLQYKYKEGLEIFKYTKEDGTERDPGFRTFENFLNLYDKVITTNDETVSGSITRDDVLAVARKIQNSLSGCISFTAEYEALELPQVAKIRLRLLSKENNDDRRIVGFKGSPIIAGIPRTISNLEYGQNGTYNSDVGVYQRPDAGGINNPSNSVAAPLDIRYNQTTGRWQSGTHQILGRLTTDIDSANVGSIDGITGTNSRNVYDTQSPSFIGQFSIGKAMPLSMENGNPYMYGPNYIGCSGDGAKKFEEIIVVNRSNRTFKRGDVVLLSNIDGEWIVQGFDTPAINKQTGVGRWQFQKFIVTSEDFFRDARYKDGTGFTNSSYILPSVYESKMRKKYLVQFASSNIPIQSGLEVSDKQEAALLSLYIDNEPLVALNKLLPDISEFDIILSDKYFQSTIFDQLHDELGGTNQHTVIGRTNILSPDQPDGIYMRDVPYFWGPAFPDGYTSASVSKLKLLSVGKKITANNIYTNVLNKFFTLEQNFSIKHDRNKHIALPYFHGVQGLFESLEDPVNTNFLQIPAEMGLNGSFRGKYSYPIERIDTPVAEQQSLPLFFYKKLFDDLDPLNLDRYSYLTYDEDGKKYDLLALSPAQPNRIQFSPLQLELALSMTEVTDPIVDQQWLTLKNTINNGKITQLTLTDPSDPFLLISQNFTTRNGLRELQLGVNAKSYLKFSNYVKHSNLQPAALGSPRIIPPFDENKSNLIGIIASKNKFSVPANTTVTFTTTQELGLSPRVSITGGQGPSVTILGAFLSWSTGGTDISQRSSAQWGGSDNINGMGSTALHLRMFDQWPDKQTFYDGRYFSVLHFNPTNGVDFTEPTLKSGQRIGDGSAVTFGTELKPRSEWLINKIRRGTLVSGGFRYYRRVIGIDAITILKKSYQENLPTGTEDVTFNGTGYQVGDTISFPGGAKIEIISVGENGSLVEGGWIIPKDSLGNFELGEGYLPNQFYNPQTKKGGLVGQQTSGSGVGGKLFVKDGKAYKKVYLDEGPKERVPITRLSIQSGDGKRKASGTLRTQITPDGGDGRYDAFYFMHNDIIHTLLDATAFDAGFAQYIILEIGAT